MEVEQKTQPPVEETVEVVEQAGAVESPPPAEQPTDVQLGAEQTVEEAPEKKEEPTPPRTYSEEEWAKRQSTMDQALAASNQRVVQLTSQAQIDAAKATEDLALAQDHQAVEGGEITEAQAAQNATRRRQEAARQWETNQQLAVAQQAIAQGEQASRILVAQKLGKKYGVDAEALMNDASLTSGELMELKASNLKTERLETEAKAAKTPTEIFDSGLLGSMGSSVDSMSPEEKILYGLKQKTRK